MALGDKIHGYRWGLGILRNQMQASNTYLQMISLHFHWSRISANALDVDRKFQSATNNL